MTLTIAEALACAQSSGLDKLDAEVLLAHLLGKGPNVSDGLAGKNSWPLSTLSTIFSWFSAEAAASR